jgi:hypothetical protein
MDLMKIAARISSGGSCIYVDLDETLIHTFSLEKEKNAVTFAAYPGEKIQNDGYGTMLRPGATEFLADLRTLEIGPIYLLTHSVAEYAGTMISAFGLDVDEVFPRESLIGKVGNGEKNFVLVDDLDSLHPVFQMKAQAIGIPPLGGINDPEILRAYYSAWQVKPTQFLGDPSDNGLEYIPELVRSYFI